MSLLAPALSAFMAVVRNGTVHGAADELNITQTAVTQRLRKLESQLNTTLFTRSRRGMLITDEGKTLLRYCHAVLEIEGNTLAAIKGEHTDSNVRVVITGASSIMRSRIIPQCSQVMKDFPNLLVEFNINDKFDREHSLKRGDCQFAIIEPEYVAKEMTIKQLAPEQYVLVCSAKWRKRKLYDILSEENIIDFEPNDDMTFKYLKHFNLFNNVKLDRHYANRTEALALLIKQCLGYGLLTKEFSEPYVKNKELMILNENKPYNNPIVLAWYQRPNPPAYFQALIDVIN